MRVSGRQVRNPLGSSQCGSTAGDRTQELVLWRRTVHLNAVSDRVINEAPPFRGPGSLSPELDRRQHGDVGFIKAGLFGELGERFGNLWRCGSQETAAHEVRHGHTEGLSQRIQHFGRGASWLVVVLQAREVSLAPSCALGERGKGEPAFLSVLPEPSSEFRRLLRRGRLVASCPVTLDRKTCRFIVPWRSWRCRHSRVSLL